MFSSLRGCQEFNKKNGFPISDCTPLEHLNGQNWFMSEPSVMFKTKLECEAFNAKQGYANGSCERFKDHDGSISFRALEGLCIMQDDGDDVVRDFQRTCARVIDNFYEKLNQTNHIAFSAVNKDNIENIFGYEQVVIMEMVNQAEQLDFQVKGVQFGIPRKNITQREAIKLDFIQSSGKQYSLTLPNPDHLHIHKKATDDEVIEVPKVNYKFSVPYKPDLQTMIYTQKHIPHEAHSVKKDTSKVAISRLDLMNSLKAVGGRQ